LRAISNLGQLVRLDLGRTKVKDLKPLLLLAKLKNLDLSGLRAANLVQLSEMVWLTDLTLVNTSISDLSMFSGYKGLQALRLDNTGVADLGPLKTHSGLRTLWLDGTKVKDLSPLLALSQLESRPLGLGLTFKSCAAAQQDPRIAEVSEIKDAKERARALFDYLDPEWETRGEEPPAADPLFEVEDEDGRLEVAASTPSEAERDERLKRVLHERLQAKADDLSKAAGNRFPRLATRARALVKQVDVPFEDLDMLGVHLAVEDLAEMARRGREEDGGEAFPEEVSVPLADVLRTGPGLTLDNEDVELLMDRARRYAAAPAPEAEKAAQDAMSHAVASDPRAIGDRLRALETQVAESHTPEAAVAQRAVNRNVLIRLGKGALVVTGSLALGVAGNLIAASHGPAITEFIGSNWATLVQAASTYGTAFADWFVSAMSQMSEFTGLAANIPNQPRKDDRPTP
jgi:hypothetical protein